MRTLATVSSQCPAAGLRASKVGQVEPGQEIFLYIAHAIFHASFLVAFAAHCKGRWRSRSGWRSRDSGIENRGLPADAFEHGGLSRLSTMIFLGTAAKGSEGVLMAGQKMLHGLGDGELQIHHAAVAEDHDKETEPAAGITHAQWSR